MPALRRARLLASLVLAWFALSLGVAVASPLVQPRTMDIVCSASGSAMLLVMTDDGAQAPAAGHLDCPLCLPTGAPPPALPLAQLPRLLPLGHAVQSIPAARIAAATAAPLPARGPPLSRA
ncbi:hypothetical protein QTH87_06850 [Variovorax sp. J22P168]|uniref:DUF2946 family protein n=1 Tax=Variovorax jilinensis TaxID=3053513 RepID=UPI0025752105|nr:DUF2946 family protein [Variovorax sp. J22P168]MDM0012158.1 hypothetical protein [Variovorax sp. J22P168]